MCSSDLTYSPEETGAVLLHLLDDEALLVSQGLFKPVLLLEGRGGGQQQERPVPSPQGPAPELARGPDDWLRGQWAGSSSLPCLTTLCMCM